MIELDAKAIPLEPGKTYLLVCTAGSAPTDSLYKLATAIKQRENINLYVLRVNGDPSQVVVKGPLLDNASIDTGVDNSGRDDEPGADRGSD